MKSDPPRLQPLVASGAVSGRWFREREGERQLSETRSRTAANQARATSIYIKAEADVSEADSSIE